MTGAFLRPLGHLACGDIDGDAAAFDGHDDIVALFLESNIIAPAALSR